MPTFLQMVNSLFLKLREEQVTSFSDSDRILVAKMLINEAARDVIDGNEWSFSIHDDAIAYFPPKRTSTVGAVINYALTGTLRWGLWTGTIKYCRDYRSKLLFTDDDDFGNIAYPVSNMDGAMNTPFTLCDRYRGATDVTADFTLFTHEMALPAEVKAVLSVRNEEGPVRIEPVDKYIEFDFAVPRVTDTFSDNTAVVYIGGTLETTSLDDVGKVYRTGFAIWPPPDSGVALKYSYIRRADVLDAEADTFQGVPEEITDIIQWVAFQKALMGNIEDDPKRGLTLFKQNEYRIKQAQHRDRPAVMRRRCMMPAVGGGSSRHPNSRWDTREVPAP